MDISRYKTEWVAVSSINAQNKRFRFRERLDISELAESMKQEGQKFPVVLWKRQSGEVQIICGFSRLEVAITFGWEKVLAITVPESELNEEESLKLSFIENQKRRSLSDPDLVICQELLESAGYAPRYSCRLYGWEYIIK